VSPRLSVVMPTRNRAGEVVRAANSVLTQDVSLELVVVDDHSDDATGVVLDELAERDGRVRVVHVTEGEPLGPCEARNRGLATARGELVGFCDDDDAWLPGAAATVLQFLDAHPDVVMASAWHRVVHVELGTSAVFRGPTHYGASQLRWQNVVAVPFAVVRRAAVGDELSFDVRLPTGEDWDLWLRCARLGPVRTVPVVCYEYFQHGGRRQTRATERQVEGRRNFVEKHGPDMGASCRLYHEAILAGYDGGRRAMLDSLTKAARRAPMAAGTAGAVLAMGTTASRVGQRRGDPGLPARLIASLAGSRRDRR